MARAALLAALPLTAVALTCTPVPLGCWDDEKGPHVVPNLAGSSATQASPQWCLDLCVAQGLGMAGITGHTTPSPDYFCYCGSSIADGSVPAPAASCNLPCPANSTASCGGSYRMSLYNASCDGPIPPPLAPGPACSQPEVASLPFCNVSLPITERAADLVARILPNEIGPQLTARNSPAIPRLGIPAFYWGTNAVHGITNAPSGGVLCVNSTGRCVTIWPSGPSLGATFNASLWRLVGQTTGVEMRALNNWQWGPVARPGQGMDGLVSWGPTINLVRDPRWGRVQETSSEDPYLNGVFATAITRGMQEGDGSDPKHLLVAATLKHFAVYSLEDFYTPAGQHVTRENVDNVPSPFDLSDSYYGHFKAAVTPASQGGGGAAGVMMAMNAVWGTPALASSQLINTLKEWAGPNNVYITTDGINMIDSMLAPEPEGHFFCPYHAPPCSRAEGIAAAVVAGSDIADGNEYEQDLITALDNGNITLGDAQQRLFNTLLIRFRLGLFDGTSDQPYLRYGASDVNTDASRAENLHAAEQSLVLLENPGAVLPFTPGQGGTTLVLGFAGNSSTSLVSNYVGTVCPGVKGNDAECYPSILRAIAALGEQVAFEQGCNSPTDCPDASVAASVAAVSAQGVRRVVLTLGISQAQEAEQHDRPNITIPSAQEPLWQGVQAACSKAGVSLVVVLVHGGALSAPELIGSGAAVVDAFYPGPAGGEAIARTLFGLASSFGKLPYTVYAPAYQTAVDFTRMDVAALGRTYRYRTPSSPGGPPLYTFGYGLSYSSFTIALDAPVPPSPVTLTPAAPAFSLSVSVTNTGSKFAADEVVQLYLAPNATSLAAPVPPFVPVRQLFAFQRVTLQPGASTSLPFSINATSALLLTLSDGTRKPVDGAYSVIISRGQGVGQEIAIPLLLSGFY